MPQLKLPIRFLSVLVIVCVVGVVASFSGAVWTAVSQHRDEAARVPSLGAPSLTGGAAAQPVQPAPGGSQLGAPATQ